MALDRPAPGVASGTVGQRGRLLRARRRRRDAAGRPARLRAGPARRDRRQAGRDPDHDPVPHPQRRTAAQALQGHDPWAQERRRSPREHDRLQTDRARRRAPRRRPGVHDRQAAKVRDADPPAVAPGARHRRRAGDDARGRPAALALARPGRRRPRPLVPRALQSHAAAAARARPGAHPRHPRPADPQLRLGRAAGSGRRRALVPRRLMTRVAILDDYQDVARTFADRDSLDAEVEVFTEHYDDIDHLEPFDVIMAMRERTPFPRERLQRLPNLKLLVTTGMGNAAIDTEAARELGITVAGTGGTPTHTAELTWGLILALARHIPQEDRGVREGRWQETVGLEVSGLTLGVIGLGRLGAQVARIGEAFGMSVVAWSQNLEPDDARRLHVTPATKDELLASADVVTIHVRLSDRTRGLIGAAELARMKPTAYLVNTSRGQI